MSAADWSTPEGLKAITESIAATIPGWRALACMPWASASSSPEPEFPHVNPPGGSHNLPGVVLAKVVGHDGSTATIELSAPSARGGGRGPCAAEACTTVAHPNLAAWRRVLGELRSNPARTAYAVFVRDVDDPVTSEADAALRALLWPDEADGPPPG